MIQPGIVSGGHEAQSAPTITSSNTFSVVHPATAVGTVTASGTAPITFSITGGANAALFSIVGSTGVLTFQAASVAGTYVVQVTATNAYGSNAQTITVTVT